MKNATPKTFPTITAIGSNDRFNTWQKDGLLTTVLISGSGFGATAPNVQLFDSFLDQTTGAIVDINARQGTWQVNGNNATYLNRAPIFPYDGRQAVTHNDPALNQGETKYGLSVSFDTDDTGFVVFCKLAVPTGKTFPAAATVETFPLESSMKMNWVTSKDWNGSPTSDDLVAVTHTGSGNFKTEGNNIDGHGLVGLDDMWEWGKWNSILTIYIPDPVDVQGPNGISNTNMWNNNGRYDSINDPFACWQPAPAGNGLILPYVFDRNSVFAFTGNGTQTNNQIVMAQFYCAIGTNKSKYILLVNSMGVVSRPDMNADVVAADLDETLTPIWDDGSISYTPTQEEMDNNTHWFLMDNQTILARGRL